MLRFAYTAKLSQAYAKNQCLVGGLKNRPVAASMQGLPPAAPPQQRASSPKRHRNRPLREQRRKQQHEQQQQQQPSAEGLPAHTPTVKKKVGGTGASHILSPGATATAALAIEDAHVASVYDVIAEHFSETRGALWPAVARFIDDIPEGAAVADVGCGNGKYLGPVRHCQKLSASSSGTEQRSNDKSNRDTAIAADAQFSEGKEWFRFPIGFDKSAGLLGVCRGRGYEGVQADGFKLPLRDASFDAVISIAVVHHFASRSRRLEAVKELARIVRPGGTLLITVWALEQERKVFPEQDVFVPWHFQHKYGTVLPSVENAPAVVEDAAPTVADDGRSTVFQRYYHLFVEGELDDLVGEAGGLNITASAYDRDNWYVSARKDA